MSNSEIAMVCVWFALGVTTDRSVVIKNLRCVRSDVHTTASTVVSIDYGTRPVLCQSGHGPVRFCCTLLPA